MSDNYYDLSYAQVAIAAALILLNGLASVLLQLGLERRLLLASLRTVAQLLLIGLILQWVFDLADWWWVVGIGAVMTGIAGLSAAMQTQRRYRGSWFDAVVSVWASSWLIVGVALVGVVGVEPWYLPQYALPLLGMVLGNTLNGIALGIDRLSGELTHNRAAVEALLCLGATRWEAARPSVRTAVRTGMVPIINSMSIVGIVSLPGMMTGQLLAGVDPMSAVKYQIVVMFLIAAGTCVGTVLAVMLGFHRLVNRHHQLRLDRIAER